VEKLHATGTTNVATSALVGNARVVYEFVHIWVCLIRMRLGIQCTCCLRLHLGIVLRNRVDALHATDVTNVATNALVVDVHDGLCA
jgi:hypothetical protein